MILDTEGTVYLSKKGNHLVKNNQTLDLTKGSEKCVKTTQIIDVTGCTKEQVQQVKSLMDSGKIDISNEMN
jgi:hypothetical protein